ncbi:MAG: dihydroneopterin aldolase [Bacteroidetes bacterium]|nr:dihydroneopterin aldolase [Bacteroidota bacterium]
MKTRVSIEGIECYAYHGCLEEEAAIGGRYQVDVQIDMDVSLSVQNDTLSDTVDYVVVNEIVSKEMNIRSKLIEHVGGRILKGLAMAFPGEKSIEVKIIKFNPPVKGNVHQTSITLKEDYH